MGNISGMPAIRIVTPVAASLTIANIELVARIELSHWNPTLLDISAHFRKLMLGRAVSLCPNFDRQVYFGAIHIEVVCKCLDNILFV